MDVPAGYRRKVRVEVGRFVADDCVLDPDAWMMADDLLRAFRIWRARRRRTPSAGASEFQLRLGLPSCVEWTTSAQGRLYCFGVRLWRADDFL